MKKIVLALALIIFSTQHTLFSMDPQPPTVQQTTTGLSEDQIVIRIDEAINTQYRSISYLFDSFYSLQLCPEDYLAIVQIPQIHYPCITDSAIDTLYDYNCFFQKSIDYFIEQASQNLEKITAATIKIIENPKNQQLIDGLNNLPFIIRTYVMNKALERAQLFSNFNYDIVLKDEHMDPIAAFDICEYTHQAIISSFNPKDYTSGKLVIWDLKTGKSLYNLGETDPIAIVTFNPNGSQIAGTLYTENTIKVWCIKTKQLLHKLFSSHAITSLSFSHPTGSLLTALYCNPLGTIQDIHINQWSLIPSENKPGELINSSYYFGGREISSPFSSDQYCASHPRTYLVTPTTELHITKKNCAPLYLCLQAIHKSEDRSHIAKLIESSASFCSLTDLEIKKVHFEMHRK